MKKYFAFIYVIYNRMLTYRATLLFLSLKDVVMVSMFVVLWSALFRGQNVIGGYSFREIVVYYILVQLFGRLYTFYPAKTLNRDIRSGDLSNFLVKPLNYPFVLMSSSFGQRLSELSLTAIITTVVFVAFPNIVLYPETFLQFIIFLAFIILSWLLFFEIAMLFGIASFWTTEISNIRVGINQMILLLGGLWIPLNLLPPWMSKIVDMLPFKYLYYFLVQVYQSKVSNEEIMKGFVSELMWIVILAMLIKYYWSIGIKRYENYGR